MNYIVAVYLTDRCFGGPEEGGWWYEAGQLTRIMRIFRSQERAYGYCRRLNTRLQSRAIGPNIGRRDIGSVLSDGEYQANVWENMAPAGFPERRPHYC